ncbi:porin [Flavobacteriaceae bacterium]|nr:porin [Flavobacteriaceae bacterium]
MKKLITLLSLAVVGFTFGQEEEPKLNLSGSVDAYYRANLDAPNDENAIAPRSSFANLPGFSLGMANIVASYEASNVGVVADLVFGPRGTDAVFASPMNSNSANIINQMYAYWNVNETVTLTMGNFNTFLGYEVISPVGNFNYSTSYLFSYGPFSHTGLKADFDFGDEFTLMAAIMNPTDLTEYNPTGDYSIGLQFGFKGQYLNYLASQGAFEVDFTGGIEFSDSFFLGINAAYFDATDDIDVDTSFAGVALYPQLSTSEKFSLGLRAEYFVETEGGVNAIGAYDFKGDADVFAVTLTGNYSVGNLMIKPELRLDSACEDATFMGNNAKSSNSLSSFVLAAVYSF